MRILLGGITLALSVAFACDQPYEEVGGYKVGCPLENIDEFELINTIDEIGMKRYTKDTTGIFESVAIDTINGEIEWVGFLTERDKPFFDDDTKDIVTSLKNRWGAFSDGPVGLINHPKNSLINEIVFYASSNPDDNIMMLMYKSNKMAKAEEELEKLEKAAKDKELSKY